MVISKSVKSDYKCTLVTDVKAMLTEEVGYMFTDKNDNWNKLEEDLHMHYLHLNEEAISSNGVNDRHLQGVTEMDVKEHKSMIERFSGLFH